MRVCRDELADEVARPRVSNYLAAAGRCFSSWLLVLQFCCQSLVATLLGDHIQIAKSAEHKRLVLYKENGAQNKLSIGVSFCRSGAVTKSTLHLENLYSDI